MTGMDAHAMPLACCLQCRRTFDVALEGRVCLDCLTGETRPPQEHVTPWPLWGLPAGDPMDEDGQCLVCGYPLAQAVDGLCELHAEPDPEARAPMAWGE